MLHSLLKVYFFILKVQDQIWGNTSPAAGNNECYRPASFRLFPSPLSLWTNLSHFRSIAMATSLYLWQQKPAGRAMHIVHVQFCPEVYQQCLHVPNILFPYKICVNRIGSLWSIKVTENWYWCLHGPSRSHSRLIQRTERDFESQWMFLYVPTRLF